MADVEHVQIVEHVGGVLGVDAIEHPTAEGVEALHRVAALVEAEGHHRAADLFAGGEIRLKRLLAHAERGALRLCFYRGLPLARPADAEHNAQRIAAEVEIGHEFIAGPPRRAAEHVRLFSVLHLVQRKIVRRVVAAAAAIERSVRERKVGDPGEGVEPGNHRGIGRAFVFDVNGIIERGVFGVKRALNAQGQAV